MHILNLWRLPCVFIFILFFKPIYFEKESDMLTYYSHPLRNGVVPTSALIFLHGLRDQGKNWSPFFEKLYTQLPNTIFVFPDAPLRKVTINNRMEMPAWYDIASFDENAIEDRAGFDESSKEILKFINHFESKGIPRSKIILGGFSQGAALTLYAALSNRVDVAGYICLSGYLPFLKTDYKSLAFSPTKAPFFIGHGTEDPLILVEWGKKTAKSLSDWHIPVTFKIYPGLGHSVSLNEQADVDNFIHGIFQ